MSFGFDESYYLSKNPDVTAAVARGQFLSGYDHFVKLGAAELRNPNAVFNAQEYAAANPDVLSAVSQRVFPSLWDHYITFGLAEGRAPSTALAGFNAAAYLAANPDVAAAVTAGTFKSAMQHFLSFGVQEGRSAVGADGQPITGGANGGQTFTLTTGADSSAVTGTVGNDTYNGVIDANGGTPAHTLNNSDNLNGGAGTDTLNVRVVDTTGGVTTAPQLTNIEVLAIRNEGTAGTYTFSAASAAGLTTVTNSNSVAGSITNVTNLSKAATLSLESAQGTLVADFAASVFDTTTDTANVKVSGSGVTTAGGAAAVLAIDATDATTIQNTIDRLTIESTGTASRVDVRAGNDVDTLTITGSANLTLTDGQNAFSAVKTVTADAFTGKLDLTLVNTQDLTVKLGSGDDRLNVGEVGVNLTATDSINLGTGTNTLAISDTTLTAQDIKDIKAVTGVSVLEFTTTSALTFDANAISTINAFRTSGAITGLTAGKSAVAGVSNAVAGADAVTFGGIETSDALVVANTITGAAGGAGVGVIAAEASGALGGDAIQLTPQIDNGSNVATITLNGVTVTGGAGGASSGATGTAGSGGAAINGVAFETINIVSSGATATATNALAGGAAGAATGGTAGAAGGSVVVNTNGTINVSGANDINLGTIVGTNATVDASTLTGKLTVVGEAGNNVIKGGSAADIITGGAGADVLTGNGGADTFIFAAGDSNATSVNIDSITDFTKGSDIIDFAGGAITIVQNANAVNGTAAINAEGIATFAAADSTLALRVTAAEAAINAGGTAAAGQTAIFEFSGNSYVFVSDGTDGVGANDLLIQLVGVTGLTDSTINAAGNLLIA